MRRLVTLGAAAVVATLASVVPAHADGPGQIDHVEASPNGTVKMLYAVPATASAPDFESIRVEVNGTPVEAEASPVEAGDIRRTAILALDVSDSMQGARFASAQRAALAYLENAPEDVAVGLTTFAGGVDVVAAPTTDHASLVDDVQGLSLSKGTQLYDGTLQAITQAGKEGARQVVVLSDGADTGTTPLNEVVQAAKKSDVTVNVVALEQSAGNQAKLRQITGASGGSVLAADDPDALANVFTAEADALAQQVLVEFTSDVEGEATIAVGLDADGETFSDSTFTALSAQPDPQPNLQAPVPVEVEESLFEPDLRLAYTGAIGIGLALAVVLLAVFALKPREKQSLTERHLAHYANRAEWTAQETADTRSKVNVRDSAVAIAEQVVSTGGFEERLSTKLSASGLSLTAAEWLLLHAGIAVLGALVGFLLSGGSWVVIVLALFFGGAGPWLYLSLKRSRRVKAFNSQLADTLQLMSGGLSAGLSLPQAVDTVVKEGAEPMAGELRRALVEQRLGVDIEDALEGVGDRMESKDFNWVVMAIRIQREVGGNLAELLNTVAGTLREREYLRRQVQTLSAEGRLSAWILGGLPPFFVAYLALTRPEYLSPLITTPIGWAMSGVAVLMLVAGAFWLAKTVKVEV